MRRNSQGAAAGMGVAFTSKELHAGKSLPVSIQSKLAGLESYKLSVPSSVPYYEQTY